MSFTHRLTLDDIRRIDQSDMAGHIASMGAHIREAIALADQALSGAKLPDGIRQIVVAGMGGSAIGADFVKSYLGHALRAPIVVNRSYDLPSFASEGTLVIASSYSGNTEETLSAFEEGVKRNLSIVCITTGGKLGERAKQLGLPVIGQKPSLQPRAALAFSFVPILLLCERLGLTSGEHDNLEHGAVMLDTLAERYGNSHLDDSNAAFNLASQLSHRIPVVYASNQLEALALRWKGQIQENAKHVAFHNLLPEMNHNEIEGWAHPVDLIQHYTAVALRSPDDEHPRIARRFELLKELLRGKLSMIEVRAEGSSRLERMLSLVSTADWTSVYMALFAGADPTAIPIMENLKRSLA